MIRKLRAAEKKLSGAITLVSVELFFVLLVFSASITLLIILINEIFYEKEDSFDTRVFTYLSSFVSNVNTGIMQFFTFLGSHLFLIPAWLVLLAYYFFIRKDKWYFTKLFIIAVSNLVLMFGLKFLFHRPRPLIPLLNAASGLSFPSGHAFMSFTFFSMLIYMAYREIKDQWLKWIIIIFLGIVVLLIGLSRIYLRVHYASDVLAGYCFGMLSVLILFGLFRLIEKYNAKKLPAHLNVTKTANESEVKQ
jgi:membrane-associated phospholipid phosphatase